MLTVPALAREPAPEPVSLPGSASAEKTGIPSLLGAVDASDRASTLARSPLNCSLPPKSTSGGAAANSAIGAAGDAAAPRQASRPPASTDKDKGEDGVVLIQPGEDRGNGAPPVGILCVIKTGTYLI